MEEVWKPVVDFEGWYEVSDLGRVRRVRGARGAKPGRVLVPTLNGKAGYLQVSLSRDNQRVRAYPHILVARAFRGPCPEGYEVNHKDGDRTNAALTNLEYVTRTANHRHAYAALGRQHVRGAEVGVAKLTDEAVREIKALSGKVSLSELARRFGVSHATIWHILRGRTWSHVS